MPTIIDLGQKVKTKYPGQYDDLSDEELGKRVKAKYSQYSDFQDAPQTSNKLSEAIKAPPAEGTRGLKGVGIGVEKGALSTIKGGGSLFLPVLDQTVGRVASFGNSVIDKLRGRNVPLSFAPSNTAQPDKSSRIIDELLTPKGGYEKGGFAGEQIAEFFVPGAAGSKVAKGLEAVGKGAKLAKGAGTAARLLGEAGLTYAHGGTTKDVGRNLAIDAATFGLGKTASKTGNFAGNRLLRPLAKDVSFGKNPGKALVQEGISANSMEGLGKKILSKRNEVGTQIGGILKMPEVKAQTVNFSKVVKPLNDSIESAAKGGDAKLLSALLDFKKHLSSEFIPIKKGDEIVDIATTPKSGRIDSEELFNIKKKIGDSIKWREGLDNELNKIKQKIYQAARDELNTVVNKARKTNKKIPDIAGLNERYANLVGAQSAAKRQVQLKTQRSLLGIPGYVGLISGGVSGADDLARGDIEGFLKTTAIGLGTGLAGKAAISTPVLSRIARHSNKIPATASVLGKAYKGTRSDKLK